VKSIEVATPEDTAMLSDMFHPDTSDRHSSGMLRIRTAESRCFGKKWETLSLRMSSKQEFLRRWYSSAYYNAIRQVSSGQNRPARFRHAKNPNCRIRPFWHKMRARSLSLRMSSKCEILRGWYSSAYYNAIRQVSCGHK
jgi:hypothetical protein